MAESHSSFSVGLPHHVPGLPSQPPFVEPSSGPGTRWAMGFPLQPQAAGRQLSFVLHKEPQWSSVTCLTLTVAQVAPAPSGSGPTPPTGLPCSPHPPTAEPGTQEIGPLAKLLSAGQITDKATSVLGISEGEQPGFRRCLCHPALAPCPWSVCPGLAEEGHKPR